MIYIFSSETTGNLGRALKQDKKNIWFKMLTRFSGEEKIVDGDQVYFDISGLSPANLKKTIEQLKKTCAFWGIIDPKGEAEDPALFFFEGASDYIGPALVNKGLNKKRFIEAFTWTAGRETIKTGKIKNQAKSSIKKKNIKLPAGKFLGWKSIRSGTTADFFFLYVSLSGKSNIRSMVGEIAFSTLKNQLRDLLQKSLHETDALLWMETEDNYLFLIPSRVDDGKAVVESAIKIILNNRLIGIEDLDLSIHVDLTFALHYGETIYQAPGKTGAVISETVNYIFHLGTKKAEPGRLTISDSVPEEAIPNGLKDIFRNAGSFEGIPIRHSRRFIYKSD